MPTVRPPPSSQGRVGGRRGSIVVDDETADAIRAAYREIEAANAPAADEDSRGRVAGAAALPASAPRAERGRGRREDRFRAARP
jgi:hypothetical protein